MRNNYMVKVSKEDIYYIDVMADSIDSAESIALQLVNTDDGDILEIPNSTEVYIKSIESIKGE